MKYLDFSVCFFSCLLKVNLELFSGVGDVDLDCIFGVHFRRLTYTLFNKNHSIRISKLEYGAKIKNYEKLEI